MVGKHGHQDLPGHMCPAQEAEAKAGPACDAPTEALQDGCIQAANRCVRVCAEGNAQVADAAALNVMPVAAS